MAGMGLRIDNAFLQKWEPKYDDPQVGGDERGYRALKKAVAAEMKSRGTISKETFLEIWDWKGAMRVIRHVQLDRYEALYAAAFRRAAASPPEQKLSVLLGDGCKLPGVGAPTGSTVLHFLDPETMPIIDVRTVEALFAAGLIRSQQRDLERYEAFRGAVDCIRRSCSDWSLRQIDRALFAYHKLVMDDVRGSSCHRCRP